ncbi:MAG: hypothetical protein PHN37_00480 [Candidatus Pacebacteria bacterium]|nr:hypothetical protein [Candidatus Paceibacterota bacterium]
MNFFFKQILVKKEGETRLTVFLTILVLFLLVMNSLFLQNLNKQKERYQELKREYQTLKTSNDKMQEEFNDMSERMEEINLYFKNDFQEEIKRISKIIE